MSVEENKAIVRRVYAVFSKGNHTALDELIATNWIDHDPLAAELPGLEGTKQVVTVVRKAFPDIHITIEDMIAEGDKVVARVTARGTHRGDFQGVAPTGKRITITGISIWRIAGGKVVEGWVERNPPSIMQQLGGENPPRQ